MINININQNFPDFEKFAQTIKQKFEKNGEIIADNRNIIKILEYNQQKVVVKSFKIPNPVNRFAYRFLRKSKAKRSFLNAQKLIDLNINTPLPIAYVEYFQPLLKESFYISEYFDYDFEIRAVLKNENFKNREKIFKSFISFTYSLHQKGVYHIDYSPGNILVKIKNNQYHFSIVDINRMKFIKYNNALRFKNLSRFSATEKDTTFFAREYAKIANINETYALEKLFYYHNKHQKYIENKKRLKKLI